MVFLCLAALYESWTIPLAVLLTVPLGICGAVLAATLRGLPNDVYFTVGLITIIGLAAKDAILIIEFAKDLRAQGKPLIEATVEACTLRFRPILMTGLAFVCGVLPMVIAQGAGGASQQALGTSVMGGMIAVVILALLMVPVFFVGRAARAGGGSGEGGGSGGRAASSSCRHPRRRVTQYSRAVVTESRERQRTGSSAFAEDDGGDLLPQPLDNLHQLAVDMLIAADHMAGLERVA